MEELAKLVAIERERLKIFADAVQAQKAMQEAKVAQLRAQVDLKRQHADALKIRAGFDGVLQRLGDAANLQIGQQLGAGANVARVADPRRLKAEIRVYETQARDVQLGQKASIDTRNGLVTGRVVRIDPAVDNGTVTIDVSLEGDLPRGARPDLSVEGTIEIERLAQVLFVGKPVGGSPDSTVTLFRMSAGSHEASRVPVRFGRSSVNAIEIVDGLREGDRIILSDMSAWDAHNRIRLN
jgi:HlyD family secretion protein